MIIFRNPSSPIGLNSPVVTIGSFDGVHIGHRAIIESLHGIAKQCGGTVTLITLYPHPRKVLGLDVDGFHLLSSLKEKEWLLEKAGIEALVELEFTKEFGAMSSDDFCKKILHDIIGTRHVMVGYNHHFGRNREGDFSSLLKVGEELGFSVSMMSKQEADGEKVSSTTVREALSRGDISTAIHYMGHPYLFMGRVINGVLSVEEPLKLIPPDGTYTATTPDKERVTVTIEHGKLMCPSLADGEKIIFLDGKLSD